MSSLRIKAPAKVNFYLEVRGKRPDGYHDLKMLMAPVSIFDEIEIETLPAGRIEVFSKGSRHVESGEKNICHRAAKFFFVEAKIEGGARISVEKNIPVGAGMGGGSSDAASVIMGLEKLHGVALSPESIARSAFKVGADVPFFFAKGWAWVEGIGETVTPVAEESPVWLAVVHPGVFLSTASVFSGCTNMLTSAPLPPNISGFDFRGVSRGLRNDLLAPALAISPEVGEALAALKRAGGVHSLMTGSGSAVFAVFPSEEGAKETALRVAESAPPGWKVFTARTLGGG